MHQLKKVKIVEGWWNSFFWPGQDYNDREGRFYLPVDV